MDYKKPNRLPFFGKGFSHGAYLIFIVSVGFTGCFHFGSNTPTADVISGQDTSQIVRMDSVPDSFNNLFASAATFSFYQSNDFAPVWLKSRRTTSLADSMIHIIRSVRTYGLLPQDYHIEELDNLIRNQNQYKDEFYIPKLDLLLTDAFFRIANHLKFGRLYPDSLKRYTASRLDDSLQITLLKNALLKNEIKNALESQEPKYDKYRQLQQFLRRILISTDSTEREILLSGHHVDTSVISANFMTLEINLERWRWESQLKGRHIAVNIPSFLLDVVEEDSIVFKSKVIVGTHKHKTPELDGLIRSFTIYPYWNVTRNIAVREILPQIKRDSSYLLKHQYEVLDIAGNVLVDSAIDWSLYGENNFPFTIRQREGIHNALGLIKFTFNNPYAVYLHDTNARLLFNRSKRSLSHGCIRVEKALELGRYLVKGGNIVTPDDLDQYLELRKQLTVRIENPIPVHLRYFTCDFEDGQINFYDDIYNHDEPLKKALYQQDRIFPQVAAMQ